MSKMKMSDVSCDVTFVDYVANAVKSHDSLVEEVERLRGERDELMSVIEDFAKGDSVKILQVWHKENLKNLLAKIKGEDNE